MNLGQLQQQIRQQGKYPPVEQWDPAFCGDIPLCIKHDGSWWYMDSPIGRQSLIQLFASVLKYQDGKYYLVTPAEKVGISVEDVPFIVTQWQYQQDLLLFTTKTRDQVVISADNPIVLKQDPITGQILPYCLVRNNLYARLHQNVFYQLAESGKEGIVNNEPHLLLKSGDYEFSLGELN